MEKRREDETIIQQTWKYRDDKASSNIVQTHGQLEKLRNT